jgi:hypothetical protein
MLKNAEADTPKRKHRVDPPRNEIEAYRNVVNVVNAVNGMDALLTTTSPDADKLQRAAAGVPPLRNTLPSRKIHVPGPGSTLEGGR